MTPRIDPEHVRERFHRLTEILGDIATRAEAQAVSRCPYRDRHDRCTAAFRCRHQRRAPRGTAGGPGDASRVVRTAGGDLTCTHDGTFDYRTAWESGTEQIASVRRRLAASRRHDPGQKAP